MRLGLFSRVQKLLNVVACLFAGLLELSVLEIELETAVSLCRLGVVTIDTESSDSKRDKTFARQCPLCFYKSVRQTKKATLEVPPLSPMH